MVAPQGFWDIENKHDTGIICARTPIYTPSKFSIHTSTPARFVALFGTTSDTAKRPIVRLVFQYRAMAKSDDWRDRRGGPTIWHQVLGNFKTEASAKAVPMDSYMAEDLLGWRRQSDFATDDDYVFASETMKGKQPYWPDNLMKRHIRPVAKANGINKNIGWHTFRHSFGTLLKANGEDVKTVQELLRHANSRITLDVYTQAVSSNKRAAQSKVVKMMVPNLGEMKDEKHSQNGR